MSKACIFFAEGMEECEALLVVDLCRRAGVDLKTVSITDSKEVTSSHNVTVKADALLSDISFEDVDMIILPGGMPGTKNLEACDPLMEQVDIFMEQGKYVSAICAAPSILAHRGYLDGLHATVYPSFREEVEGLGAICAGNLVEVEKQIITGCALGAGLPFSLAIVERLEGKEKAQAVAQAICM